MVHHKNTYSKHLFSPRTHPLQGRVFIPILPRVNTLGYSISPLSGCLTLEKFIEPETKIISL